ncbi:MAG TPA: LptA/OstA family protein [Candidatus Binataceae bacterium]|nr:LptA/OstA family protein [Candidatus Binataceae bacterium]
MPKCLEPISAGLPRGVLGWAGCRGNCERPAQPLITRGLTRRVAVAALAIATFSAISGAAATSALAQTGVGVGSTRPAATTLAPAAEPSPSTDDSAGSSKSGTDNNSPFGAFTNGSHGPTNIQSDTLSLDYKNNAVLFTGRVHATQGEGSLNSDTLNVKYGKDFHQVQTMVADGHVRLSQGVQWCTSDHAVLDQMAKHTLVLTGSPICHDKNDQIAGTRITVHLDSGKSDVEAAKAVIFPQQSKTRDNEPSADHVK